MDLSFSVSEFNDFSENEDGFPLFHREHDENSSNNQSQLLLDEEDIQSEEANNNSNENKINNVQKIKENKEQNNICNSKKIVEDSSPSNDKNKENENNNKDSTAPNSNIQGKSIIEKTFENSNLKEEVKDEKKRIFKTEIFMPFNFNYEASKKYWKAEISQYYIKNLNKAKENSDFPKELKKPFYIPDYKYFTGNAKESDNIIFLEQELRTIIANGTEKKNIIANKNYISEIYEYFEKIGYNNLSDKNLEVKYWLEITYEDLIKKYYDSEEFIIFKNKQKTILIDEGTKRQEGFKISENYGLIKVLARKRKRGQIIRGYDIV